MPEKIEAVMHYLEIQQFAYSVLDLLDPRVAEFHNFSAIHADNVIMLLIPV